MCGIYRCDIFITIFLGAFLTNSSELQINAEEVFWLWGNEMLIKHIKKFSSLKERQTTLLVNGISKKKKKHFHKLWIRQY